MLQQAEDYEREIAKKRQIENFYSFLDEKDKTVNVPLAAPEIWSQVQGLVGEDIRRVGQAPFVVIDSKIYWLRSNSDLFSFLMAKDCKVSWIEGAAGAVRRSDFFDYIGKIAPLFETATQYPFFPARDGVFVIKDIPPRETGKLFELVDLFTHASSEDRDLMAAAFATLFWGGEPGSRPAFVFDGIENDEKKNRGIGKTTAVDIAAELSGGYVDFSTRSDVEDMKKRMLSTSARVVRFDNIKNIKMSSDAIESLITSRTISGHRMYVGESTIPNLFTYFMTFNGATFGKDMAQRSVIVRLARSTWSADWGERLAVFLNEHRDDVIADIGYLLSKSRTLTPTLTRFPSWERGVLQLVAKDPTKAAKKIGGEQAAVDDDDKLADELREFFCARICEYEVGDRRLNGMDNPVLIRSSVCAEWLNLYMGTKMCHRSALQMFSRNLPKIIDSVFKTYAGYRYYLWDPARDCKNKEEYHRPDGKFSAFTIESLWPKTVGAAKSLGGSGSTFGGNAVDI